MAFFFKDFPIIPYNGEKLGIKLEGNDFQSYIIQYIRNPIVRFKIIETVKNYISVYYPYTIQDNESPDFIANQYYGNPTLEWVIYFINDMYDPQWEWPKNPVDFDKWIIKKYGSTTWAKQNIKQYEIKVRDAGMFGLDTPISERWLVVDENTYNNHVPLSGRRDITYYFYEQRENENRREIKLMKKEFITPLTKEIQRVLKL